jgi:hypothetical protein
LCVLPYSLFLQRCVFHGWYFGYVCADCRCVHCFQTHSPHGLYNTVIEHNSSRKSYIRDDVAVLSKHVVGLTRKHDLSGDLLLGIWIKSVLRATSNKSASVEILTAVVIKISIAWTIPPCSPFKVN